MKKYIYLFVIATTVLMASCKDNKSANVQPASQEPTETEAMTNLAPDFTLNDLQGNPLTLSSLRGKPVVLDFWGSWCIWCVRGVPSMKEYYEKYKGKFEILGIDCNEDEATWEAAVKKLELPWLHVYCPDDSPLLKTYEIQGFPTKVIIDSEGKIYKTIIGEDPEFYKILDELLG